MADDERSEGFAWASDWFLCRTALLNPPTLILQQFLVLCFFFIFLFFCRQ
jgi:hypothetical protein